MTRTKILIGAGVALFMLVLYLINPFAGDGDDPPRRPPAAPAAGSDEQFLRDHRLRPEEPAPPPSLPPQPAAKPLRKFPYYQPPPPPPRPRPPAPPPPAPKRQEPASLRVFHRDPPPPAPKPSVRLPKGALLHAQLLETARSGEPGPVTALVTRPFVDRGRELVPMGTRVVGQIAAADRRQRGVELTWTDFYFPDGSVARLPGEPSTDATGGLPDAARKNRPWARAGAALAAIATSVAVRAAEPAGSLTIAGSATQESAETADSVLGRWAERTLNAPPRLVLAAGSPIYIRVVSDVELSVDRP